MVALLSAALRGCARVHIGRGGLVTVTLPPTARGVRGLCGAVSALTRAQRRGYNTHAAGGLPPPPPPPPPHFFTPAGSEQQQKGPVVVQVKQTRADFFRRLIGSTALALLALLLWSDSLRVPAGTGREGMAGAKRVTQTDLTNFTTTFSEVLGCEEAKEELEEIVLFLKDPQRFTRLGGKLPKGALMVGPPGTGKTLLAKAIAKEAGVPFFYMSGAEFDEVFVGVGSRRVRDLFEAAKKVSPALIFIDELDAIGSKRSPRDQSYHRMTLNQLLSEMDGFLSKDEVIVLAATNTPKSLDSALTRPGRFDRIINVDPPDLKGREQILRLYLSKVHGAKEIDAHTLAKGLPGYVGADLQNIVNVAAIHAAMQDKEEVDNDDLEYAKDRVSMGAENRSKIIPEQERKVTAWHEAGHALAALLSAGADPVHKATIVPRGNGVLGLVLQHPQEDRYSMSREMMQSRLVVALAGRVGEEELLGASDVTAGAASDFESATSLARTMVRQYGMAESEVGTINYASSEDTEGAYLSDATKEKIEAATRSLLDEAFNEAKRLVREHRPKLQAIAEALLTHETLNHDQLQTIINGGALPPPPEVVPVKAKAAEASPPTPPPPPRGSGPKTILVEGD